MRTPTPGRHRDVAAFRAHLRGLDPAFDADEALEGADGPLGAPLDLGGFVLHNRFAVQPMEGWDGTREGLPSAHTLRRWRRFGRSTAKLVWGGEAFAVTADGRANPNQLYLNDGADVAGGLARLLAEVRAGHAEMGEDPDELYVGLQLTHSGRYARPDGPPAPRRAVADAVLDARLAASPGAGAGDAVPGGHDEQLVSAQALVTDGELEELVGRYVAAARLAREAGFHFVDVKACHGYLVHELLGARARPGPYGGSFEGRTRFLREVVAAVQRDCPGLAVGVRLSVGDVFPHVPDPQTGVGIPSGWERQRPWPHGFGVDLEDPRRVCLDEPLALIGRLAAQGVRLLNVSLGSPYTCPHLSRPAEYPPSDGYLPPVDPLASVLEHLRATRECKAAHPGMVVVGTGYTYLMEWLPHVAQHELRHGHVDLVGLGRMVLSYPELPADVLAGRPLDRKRICRTFSDCTTGPRHGLPSGCYPLDAHYRELPEGARLRAIKQELRG